MARSIEHTSIVTLALASAAILCASAGQANVLGRELIPQNTSSLLFPGFQRSEIIGFVAGLGTTFAALPDLIAMYRRRSSAGMNPRMAFILGAFQIVWVYYGLLILSRPVIFWNVIAVAINLFSVRAYFHFARLDRTRLQEAQAADPNVFSDSGIH